MALYAAVPFAVKVRFSLERRTSIMGFVGGLRMDEEEFGDQFELD
jgi:hypothetical protein